MRNLFIVGLLLVGSLNAFGQSIAGKVQDSETHEPLIGAVVIWKNTRAGTITNALGEFSIGRIPSTDTLQVEYVGYLKSTFIVADTREILVELKMNIETQLNIEEDREALHIHGKDPHKFQTLNEKELCKAACCNLSESFETNASVDGSYTDGVTGTRQIKMLGLDGKYAQIMSENIPDFRGLSTVYGLSWIPGPWIKEISISKGAGSILPGYESMAGQINIAHKGHEMKEKVFLNLYAGNQGRYEINTVSRHEISHDIHWQLFSHAALNNGEFDMNHDGFLDNPVGKEYNGRIQMSIEKENGFRGDYNAQYLNYANQSGSAQGMVINPIRINNNQERWNVQLKNGWILPTALEQSIGSQISVSDHHAGVNVLEIDRNYSGRHSNARVSLLHLLEWNHEVKLTYGMAGVWDRYQEQLSDFSQWSRIERSAGAFAEFSWNHQDVFQSVLGARWEYHNLFGALFTPRVHFRYSFTENTHLKLMSGVGRRTANVIMDQPGILASNRQVVLSYNNISNGPLGLPMEVAWNSGVVFTHKAKWFYRDASLTLDAFLTDFKQQVVIDWDQTGEVNIYPLHGRHGKSQSRTIQMESNFTPVKRLDVRLAYRWVDTYVDYESGRRSLPFISKNRALINLAYSTKMFDTDKRLIMDLTTKWNDAQRLPSTADWDSNLRMPERSPAFWMVNSQFTYAKEERWDVYLGIENIFNFKQQRVVIYSNGGTPETTVFDGNFAYAPAFGRMYYLGFRWRLGAQQ
jgi:outer membrane receptor for ferrienterochelin and colicins